MEEFFKAPTQEEIDRQWLTQLCYDGGMADDEIEEFVDAVIQWKDKAVQCALADVSNRRELLLAFYQHLIDNDPFPINSFSKEREVDRFLKANNCC